MGKKIEKVKAFCKEHKKEIAVAVVAGVGVVVGVTACVVMKKKLDISNGGLVDGVVKEVFGSVTKPEANVGKKHYKYFAEFGSELEVWNPTKHEGLMVISHAVPLENVGHLGEELMNLDGNLKPDSLLGVIIQDVTKE